MPRNSDRTDVIAGVASRTLTRAGTRLLKRRVICGTDQLTSRLLSHKRWLHEEGHIEFAHPLIIIGCESSVVEIV